MCLKVMPFSFKSMCLKFPNFPMCCTPGPGQGGRTSRALLHIRVIMAVKLHGFMLNQWSLGLWLCWLNRGSEKLSEYYIFKPCNSILSCQLCFGGLVHVVRTCEMIFQTCVNIWFCIRLMVNLLLIFLVWFVQDTRPGWFKLQHIDYIQSGRFRFNILAIFVET